MEPVTFLVVGLSVGVASALTWNLYHARSALQNVSDRTIVLSESQGAHAKQTTDALVLLQKKIDHYDDLLGALRATHPTVDFGMRAHQSIASLEGGIVSASMVQDAIDAVYSSIPLQSVDIDLSPMQAQMTSRLLSVLDQNGLTMTALSLDGRQALQVGLCSLHLQNIDWAESAFGVAHQALPGNVVVLQGLEKVALLKADDVLRLHWLEAQLRIDPDNPDFIMMYPLSMSN